MQFICSSKESYFSAQSPSTLHLSPAVENVQKLRHSRNRSVTLVAFHKLPISISPPLFFFLVSGKMRKMVTVLMEFVEKW